MSNILKCLLCLLFPAVVCTSAAVGHAESSNDATLSPFFLIENGDPALADPETFSGDRYFILNYRLAGDEINIFLCRGRIAGKKAPAWD